MTISVELFNMDAMFAVNIPCLGTNVSGLYKITVFNMLIKPNTVVYSKSFPITHLIHRLHKGKDRTITNISCREN